MLKYIEMSPIARAVSNDSSEWVALSWLVTAMGRLKVELISISKTPTIRFAPLGA
jgi:hypothetical protein